MGEFVIWSYEHNSWWGPQERGYVSDLSGAGRYSEQDAGRIVTNSTLLEEIAIEVHALDKLFGNLPPKFHPYRGE